MKFKILFSFLYLIFCFSCGTDSTSESQFQRAQQPWVFRSVLDETPRVVTLALNDNLWAAYNTNTCALYKIWKGFVNLDGAVYTTVHGPQPTSVGNAYFVNQHDHPWSVSLNGKDQAISKVQYRGHRYQNGQAHLNYEIQLQNGDQIELSEQPEYVQKGDGINGFERIYSIKNNPKNYEVVLKTNASSVALESSIETDGNLKILNTSPRNVKNISGLDVDATLILNNDKTTLTTWFVKKPLIENTNKIKGAEDEEERPLGFRLIARSDCKSCHNTYNKTVGPAYLDIARKYDNTPENVAMLANKVKHGGGGVWGTAVMTAHADLDDGVINSMVEYVMSLDAEEEAKKKKDQKQNASKEIVYIDADTKIESSDMLPGVLMKYVQFENTDTGRLDDMDFGKKPSFEGIVPNIDITDQDLAWAGDDFGFEITGYIEIPKDNNYVFRLISDDGSRLYIDGNPVIDHDGWHGASAKDGELALKKGFHPFKIIYFQGAGGKSLRFYWRSFDDPLFKIIPASSLSHHKDNQAPNSNIKTPPLAASIKIPGDGHPLEKVHPSYDIFQARPNTFLPKVGGIDFLSDGRMVVSTWDPAGTVYVLDNVLGDDPEKITVTPIASGFAEPLGVKVVNDEIYILQKQELTKLIDHDGDGQMDEYKVMSNDWDVSDNFHEFAFGLVEKDGWLYGNLAIGIMPGGASAKNQPKQRGNTFRVNINTGQTEYITTGMRTPNGIGIGVDNEIFVADNQGDWLPASKIMHVQKGAWFGSRAVDYEGTADLTETKPLVWLPQDEIGNSPSTPLYLNDGRYKGQMIHGEVTNGGVKRVFVEKVNGAYQGCVFRFIQGLESGVNRIQWGPDGSLYAGGVGSTGNWGHTGKLWYGLQRLKYNDKPVFEMLAVRAKSNGIEIEFTEPLREGDGWDANAYDIQQWYYQPTKEYGGPKLDETKLNIRSVNVSDDRKKVFLELDGMKENHVIYIHLLDHWLSANNNGLWSTEAWYTMNAIPENTKGFFATQPTPKVQNTLTQSEKAAGWKLLFDGKTTDGWRNYRKETIGSSWKVEDGALMLDVVKKDDGGWQAKDGGDIVYDQVFENYEFEIEWKIQACGNSGIMYNVEESEAYDYPWMTGPEMQVLDNTCHPDARIPKHRAADLYDLISCEFETVKPAGEWNQARLVVDNGQVEHWLNGYKLVEYELWTDEFKAMLAKSKWKDFPDFGTKKKGKIALQDHGDRVWFRNIKIREIK